MIYFGTADFAVPGLKKLAERNDKFEVVAVVTQPDRPGRRGMKLQPSPVKRLAMELNLPALQPEKARSKTFLNTVRDLSPDVGVVAAYGQILKQNLLDIPKYGCVNIHGSILPKYRGAAPIQWALWDGQDETGVTLIRMDAGLDTGDMFAWTRTAISSTDTAQTLHDRLASQGANLLSDRLEDFILNRCQFVEQNHQESTYARKITREDGWIDWNLNAKNIDLQIRALTPWPGAETTCYVASQNSGTFHQKRLKIIRAHLAEIDTKVDHSTPGRPDKSAINQRRLVIGCGEGSALEISCLQLEGKRPMEASAFLAGYSLDTQHCLGEINSSK